MEYADFYKQGQSKVSSHKRRDGKTLLHVILKANDHLGRGGSLEIVLLGSAEKAWNSREGSL
jgi:hypothetical protein